MRKFLLILLSPFFVVGAVWAAARLWFEVGVDWIYERHQFAKKE